MKELKVHRDNSAEDEIYVVIEDYSQNDGVIFDFVNKSNYKNFLRICNLEYIENEDTGENHSKPSMVWAKNYRVDGAIGSNKYNRTYKLNLTTLQNVKPERYNDSYVIGFVIECKNVENLIVKQSYGKGR